MVSVHRVTTDPRYPLGALIDLVEKPEDFEELLALRAMTDPVALDAFHAISLVPAADRYVGRRAALVMRPFLIMGFSRWSPGTYGVLYTADSLQVAIREASYHADRTLRATHATSATTVPRYGLTFRLDRSNHADVRDPNIYDPERYGAAQTLGASLRANGSDGVYYDSVRSPGGHCYGTFRPRAITNVSEDVQEIELVWDGSAITDYRMISTHPI